MDINIIEYIGMKKIGADCMHLIQKRNIRYIIVLCLLFLLTSCSVDEKNIEQTPEFVLTYAENHPDNYPTVKGALKFAELVEERTDGKVVIQVKSGGEFGTQQQMVNQMKFGGIDFARVSLSSISDELPKLNVLQLPYLYENSQHMWEILDGEIGTEFWESFYELNLVPLSWYDAGARSFYSVKPIRTVEDMEGMSIRVQESKMMQDMISLLGGIPVDLAYTEVYSAFETGKIDGAENSWPSYQIMGHCRVARYYTLDEHTRVPEIQLMSGRTWEKLPEKYQTILLECAKESAIYEKELWKEQEEISRQEAVAQGCEIILLSEEEIGHFREKMTPLYELYCSEYMDIVEEIVSYSDKRTTPNYP